MLLMMTPPVKLSDFKEDKLQNTSTGNQVNGLLLRNLYNKLIWKNNDYLLQSRKNVLINNGYLGNHHFHSGNITHNSLKNLSRWNVLDLMDVNSLNPRSSSTSFRFRTNENSPISRMELLRRHLENTGNRKSRKTRKKSWKKWGKVWLKNVTLLTGLSVIWDCQKGDQSFGFDSLQDLYYKNKESFKILFQIWKVENKIVTFEKGLERVAIFQRKD